MTYTHERAIGDELKLKIIEVIGGSPAKDNSGLVFACLVELALTIAHNTWDAKKVADLWNRAMENVEHSPVGPRAN